MLVTFKEIDLVKEELRLLIEILDKEEALDNAYEFMLSLSSLNVPRHLHRNDLIVSKAIFLDRKQSLHYLSIKNRLYYEKV